MPKLYQVWQHPTIASSSAMSQAGPTRSLSSATPTPFMDLARQTFRAIFWSGHPETHIQPITVPAPPPTEQKEPPPPVILTTNLNKQVMQTEKVPEQPATKRPRLPIIVWTQVICSYLPDKDVQALVLTSRAIMHFTSPVTSTTPYHVKHAFSFRRWCELMHQISTLQQAVKKSKVKQQVIGFNHVGSNGHSCVSPITRQSLTTVGPIGLPTTVQIYNRKQLRKLKDHPMCGIVREIVFTATKPIYDPCLHQFFPRVQSDDTDEDD